MKRKGMSVVLAAMMLTLALGMTACGKKKEAAADEGAASAVSQTSEVQTSEVTADAGDAAASTASQLPAEDGTGANAADVLPTEIMADQTTAAAADTGVPTVESFTGENTSVGGFTFTAEVTPGVSTTEATVEDELKNAIYPIKARILAEASGSLPYVKETGTNTSTFWTEMNYLVSAYGSINERISYDSATGIYELKKEQLRIYAAALYAELGKAKSLPDFGEGVTGVARLSKTKYDFTETDLSAFDVVITSCAKQSDKSYQLVCTLVDNTSGSGLFSYTANVKKSPYKNKKSPFHYTIVSLEQMKKRSLETVLVGGKDTMATQSAAAGTVTGTASADGTAAAAAADGSGHGMLTANPQGSLAGATAAAAQDPVTAAPAAGADQTTAASQTQQTQQTQQTAPAQTQAASSITGAAISSEDAKKVAETYMGNGAAAEGGYTLNYKGITEYSSTQFYDIAVYDGDTYVVDILISGDGARILKGTEQNGSWNFQ